MKQLLLEKTRDDKDLQTICFGFNEERLEDDDKTLTDYDIEDGSLLQLIDLNVKDRSGFGFMGSKFADLSNSKGLKIKEWYKTAPDWRISSPGLCLEGSCTNNQCEAHKLETSAEYRRTGGGGDPA